MGSILPTPCWYGDLLEIVTRTLLLSSFRRIQYDLFLIFGFWHAYHYAYVALWDEFRSTFLAKAFWLLYPTHNLMRRPKNTQSTTFFMWLRLAYPHFREKLVSAITTLKDEVLSWELSFMLDRRLGKDPEKGNPHLPFYVHIVNLYHLFEFCIPCIQDYGSTLKGNDWPSFHKCYKRMLLFYISCSTKGASDYARSMFMFDHLLRYWIRLGLPIMELFNWNHTIFLEESGEVVCLVSFRVIGFWLVNDTSLDVKDKTFQDTRSIALLVPSFPPLSNSYSLLTQSILQFSGLKWILFIFDMKKSVLSDLAASCQQ